MLTAGQAVAAAGEIEMTISEIREIATRTMSELQGQAENTRTPFGNLALPPGAFGEVPLGQALGRQHQAAHDVFVQTIDGIVADLRDFQQRLLQSAESQESTDDAAQAALVSLGQGYADHTFRSTESYDTGRAEHGQDLEAGEEAAQAEGLVDEQEAPAEAGSDSGASPAEPAASPAAAGESADEPATSGASEGSYGSSATTPS
jgi:hypothetical protein